MKFLSAIGAYHFYSSYSAFNKDIELSIFFTNHERKSIAFFNIYIYNKPFVRKSKYWNEVRTKSTSFSVPSLNSLLHSHNYLYGLMRMQKRNLKN